jgi:hypothetical protein
MKGNFEFETTYRCNTVCKHCNRLLGVIDLPDSDLTPTQTAYACCRLRETRFWPDKVKFSGGEPRLNPYLQIIVRIVKEQLEPDKTWVLTNGSDELNVRKPRGTLWGTNPLPKTNHDPFLVSPVQAGLDDRAMMHACTIRSECGFAFDAHGFTSCPLAPMLGRLLRINPYSPYPIFDQDHEICRHCPHSLRAADQHKIFAWAKKAGNYPSPIFKAGLLAYRTRPFIIRRLEPEKNEVSRKIRREILQTNRKMRTCK